MSNPFCLFPLHPFQTRAGRPCSLLSEMACLALCLQPPSKNRLRFKRRSETDAGWIGWMDWMSWTKEGTEAVHSGENAPG